MIDHNYYKNTKAIKTIEPTIINEAIIAEQLKQEIKTAQQKRKDTLKNICSELNIEAIEQ